MRELGFACDYNCATFVTRKGGKGTLAHFDASHNFTLQVEGSKEWRISRSPAERSTQQHVHLGSDGEVQSRTSNYDWEDAYEPYNADDTLTFVLEPGDALYIPSGAWHAVRAVGEAQSVSSAISFRGRTFPEVLRAALDKTLLANETWRELPCRRAEQRGEDMGPELRDYFRTVLIDLKAFIEKAEANPFPLYAELQRFVAAPEISRSEEAQAEEEPATIEPGSTLYGIQCPSPVARGEADDGSDVFYVFHRNGHLVFDEQDLIPFARKLAVTRRFRAEESLAWTSRPGEMLEWSRVEGLLQVLVGIGYLSLRPVTI
jgi:hypothetical protein